jgi:hypothetical protein
VSHALHCDWRKRLTVRVCAVPGDLRSEVRVATDVVNATAILTVWGTLVSTTYRTLRDRVIKAALDEPQAVIVDVTHLDVPAESAWAVFTSARWLVARWPEVPIVLVCEHPAGRSAMMCNGITRFVQVYPTIRAATDATSCTASPRWRQRTRVELSAEPTSLRQAREVVSEWLTVWSHTELIPVTKVVVTAFVENVLQHTASNPTVRLEFDGCAVTVAVEDSSHLPASLREEPKHRRVPSGLHIVSALCRAWGNAPTSTGKTVWAVIGPENRL